MPRWRLREFHLSTSTASDVSRGNLEVTRQPGDVKVDEDPRSRRTKAFPGKGLEHTS